MIVPMQKMYAAVRADQKDRLLTTLRKLGVVHLQPVDAEKAHPDEKTASTVQRLSRAKQVLGAVAPAGEAPDMKPLDAADRALELYGQASDLNTRLASLAREADQLSLWGDVKLESFAALREAGLLVKLYRVSPDEAEMIAADCRETIAATDTEALVAAAYQGEEGELPKSAQPIELPERDRPTLRAKAGEIDDALKAGVDELARLASKLDDISAELAKAESRAAYAIADHGGLAGDVLFAVQGWVPEDAADSIPDDLAAAGFDAGVEFIEPDDDEKPPTLVRYPGWAKPIKALFDILGTVPGYKEFDLSPFFMVAMPLFAAMLIGDAGYGLIFTIIAVLAFKRLKAVAGAPASQLLLVFGLTTTAWGMLSGNLFGVSPGDMINSGGMWAPIGEGLKAIAVLWNEDPDIARNTIIKISFVIGTIHLVLAHVRQALGVMPNIRFLAEVGWSIFLIGMLGIVWMLFFPDAMWMPLPVMKAGLVVGITLVLLFTAPSRNPFKMIGIGIAANLLPTIGTFSDTMSYIRLMAVGLASYYIASAFNGLAVTVAGDGGFMLIPAAIILVLAHTMNILLGIIAIFAHGVRLNMLEFSSNAGVQWEGYAYAPFKETLTQ